MSLALNGRSVTQRYEDGDGLKMDNEVMFSFYLDLPNNYGR